MASEAPSTYVVDTSVVLADPQALHGFAEHELVVPAVVLAELERKRSHAELGWAARTALRTLEQLRVDHGSLLEPVPVTEAGGTLRVELDHCPGDLPEALSGDDADGRILAVARALQAAGRAVVLVTKDLPLRLRASLAGIEAQEYRGEQAASGEWSGVTTLSVGDELVDGLFADRLVDLDVARELPCHTGVILQGANRSALGRVHADKRLHLVDDDRALMGLRGRSAEQRLAVDLLADPEVGIVSLGGPAGTGKSVLALAAGLEAVLERATHRKVTVFRPLYPVGGQDLGYLPGTEGEKMAPWSAAVRDALEAVVSPTLIDEVEARELVEVRPLTHIRGRTLTGAFVIVDEAQNLERTVLLTALSRLGDDSRVVLTHDLGQRDNLRVGRHDGIASIVEDLAGHPLFAHVTLTRSERSPVAELVGRLLEGRPLDELS
jgi:PhoH-like ATPase